MSPSNTIVRCISCDGYGWFQEDGSTEDCDWCGGVGYMYRDAQNIDHRIPRADLELPLISDQLEALELQRLRELGYTGTAVHPRDQKVRQQKRDSDSSPR